MKFKKYIALGFLAAGLFTSCDLDLYPYNSIDPEHAFTSVQDAEKWDTRLFADLRGRVYGHFLASPDIQADQLNAVANFGNNFGDVHRWTNLISDNYQIRDVWSGYYFALNNVNTAIKGYASITPKDAAETAKLNQYVGDAHLARAYYYFMLTARFGKAYDETTAATDLAVPLVLAPDLLEKPSRNTIKEAYDQILSDLEIAKTNLATLPGSSNAKKFNIDVALALEARVKLFKKDWAGAKAAAELLISGGKYKLYASAADLKKMWHEDAGNEVIFAPFVSRDELPNTNTIYLGLNQNTKKYQPSYIPSQWVYDTYEANDFRKNIFFLKDAPLFINGKDFTGIVVNKYPGNPALYTGVTNYAHSPKVFRIAEMYLIAAEAAFRSSPSDAAGALSNLNALRVSRGLAALSGLAGTSLFDEIKAERFRELAFEGFRFEDLKRWEEGFKRRSPQTPLDMVEVGPDFDSKTVPAKDNKFTWGIPNRDQIANPNIVQNPGW